MSPQLSTEDARRIGRASSFLLLMLVSASALAQPSANNGRLHDAIELFKADRFDEAERKLGELATQEPNTFLVRFWLAYSLYKQNRVVEAKVEADAALRLDEDSVDARYLSGLLAFGGRELDDAKGHFEVVDARAPNTGLGQSARKYLDKIQWQRDLGAAIDLFGRGDFDDAAAQLDHLLQSRPKAMLALYYRGYTDFKRERWDTALGWFDKAVEVQRNDDWSRFMRALTLARLGRQKDAKQELVSLSRGADSKVASEAQAALSSFDSKNGIPVAAAVQIEKDHDSGSNILPGDWRLSAAVDFDSNPAFIPESSYSAETSSAFAVSTAASGQLAVVRRGNMRVLLGPRVSLRFYPDGPDEYHLAQLETRIELNHRADELRGWVGLGGGVSWLGWRLFLDVEEAYAGGSWEQTKWTNSRLVIAGYRRGSHVVEYQNLNAVGIRGSLSQTFKPTKRFKVQIGYGLQGEFAKAYSFSWSGDTSDEEPVPFEATLAADATFFGHGPLLGASLALPWRELRLSASASYQWRRYPEDERIDFNVDGEASQWNGTRNGSRLTASARASVKVTEQLYAFVNYSGIVNSSTLGGPDSPVDRNYGRHLLLGGVEARF